MAPQRLRGHQLAHRPRNLDALLGERRGEIEVLVPEAHADIGRQLLEEAQVVVLLEDVAAEEIAGFGLAMPQPTPGAVLFEGPAFPSPRGFALLRELNDWARGLDRVGALIAAGDAVDLDDCYELARRVDYEPLIRHSQTFAVRAERSGAHDFTSVDVGRMVGQAVIDSFAATAGTRLRASLRCPDVIFRVDLRQASCRMWLDATGDEPLYRRDYRTQLHPASLRATLAYSMLWLAAWRGEPLIDPMTGIGTIPIEAGLYAHAVPPGSFRRTPLALDVMCRGRDVGDSGLARRKPAEITLPGPLPTAASGLDVLGIERYEKHLLGARGSLAAVGDLDGIRFRAGDARHLDKHFEAGRYKLAVLNPPFGRKVGSTAVVGALYRSFALAAARSGVERIVVLAEGKRIMSDALSAAGFDLVRSLPVMFGRLPIHTIIAQREGA